MRGLYDAASSSLTSHRHPPSPFLPRSFLRFWHLFLMLLIALLVDEVWGLKAMGILGCEVGKEGEVREEEGLRMHNRSRGGALLRGV